MITLIGIMALCLGACGEPKEEEKAAPAEPETEAVSEPKAEGAVILNTEEVLPEETEEEEEEMMAAEIEYPTFPLPEYHYFGPEDWADYGDAISQFLIENNLGEQEADLSTCTPVVLKVDESDPSDVKVWGEFRLDQFLLQKTSLLSTAGGSHGGLAHLDTTGGSPVVTGIDFVEDGSDNGPSIDRIFGAEGLKEAYGEALEDIDESRALALSYYINQNGIYITQFQDFGWAPIPIPNAPETREEDQIVDHVSNFAYTAQYDMRQLCCDELEGWDIFSTVRSDEWNDALIEITIESGTDPEPIISQIEKEQSDYPSWKEPERSDDAVFAGTEGCILLTTPAPYEDGQKVFTTYLVPRDGDFLVVKITSDFSSDDEKQMATDGIIEGFLGTIELK